MLVRYSNVDAEINDVINNTNSIFISWRETASSTSEEEPLLVETTALTDNGAVKTTEKRRCVAKCLPNTKSPVTAFGVVFFSSNFYTKRQPNFPEKSHSFKANEQMVLALLAK